MNEREVEELIRYYEEENEMLRESIQEIRRSSRYDFDGNENVSKETIVED